jgi:hypothetical protein
MESRWHPELSRRPVRGKVTRGVSRRWDWWLVSFWLLALGLCVAFWWLVGLTMSQIAR